MDIDIKDFDRLVNLGLGRAVLRLLDQSAELYREGILDACLHNKAYDPQIEGSRADYMMDLIRNTGDLSLYADAVLVALAEEAGESDTWQRFRIARLLAQEGNQRARQAMRTSFDACPDAMLNTFAEEFIELDGIEGLLYVVNRRGAKLRQSAERWEDEYLVGSC